MARKRSRKSGDIAAAVQIPGIEPVKIPAPQVVLDKVRQFAEHSETYESTDYSEAQLRIDFLNPLLEALGWDVNNTNGYAEAYRDVVYEDALKVGGTTKAPDYGFYIGGRAAGGGRKFFLEAKKPSVAVRVDPKSAFQLRRYAYTAGLPLSILTNFKEFLVFDTRIKPRPKDSASAGVILRVPYTEYPTRWNEIASIFARESILKGSFDKYAQAKRKKGVVPIGESFLADIEEWREALAKEIAASNPDIEVDELNFAVQRTIDRILFLRICEDRGIEPTGNLLGVTNGDRVYERLGQVFVGADDRYNSGIFHFPPAGKKPDPDRTEPPDDLTLGLAISDKPLRKIIRSLYDVPGHESSYEFSVMPPEILGQVYEQFLGKVISLTPAHHVKIEDKPEVRKAGGVYYTPSYIVDYIVQETIGKLLEGKTPKDAAKIRVLDPASGSGSFLIGAYQFLLDWHLRWYLENDPDSHLKGRNPALVRVHSPSFAEDRDAGPRGREGTYDYRLSTAKRKEILLNSIYGVDIDAQAVEVTKLSLLLKVLEGESQESVNAQLKMFHQRALPDLGKNIKCGNSLISDDFDDSELSEEERAKVNKFNWQREFPAIFKAGGFDAVIGNPPYIQLSMSAYYNEDVNNYYAHKFSSSMGRLNTFGLFAEESFSNLVRASGYVSFIVPNTMLTQEGYRDLRRLMLKKHIVNLTGFVYPVFVGAVVETVIFVARNESPNGKSTETVMYDNRAMTLQRQMVNQSLFERTHNKSFLLLPKEDLIRLRERIDEVCAPLGDVANINQAIALAYDRKASIFRTNRGENYKKVLDGRNIGRYRLEWGGEYLAYDVKKIHSCKRTDIFEAKEKIFFRRVGDRLIATYDTERYYALNTLVVITLKEDCALSLKCILGIINATLLNVYYVRFLKSTKKVFSEIQARQLAQLPIPLASASTRGGSKLCDELDKAVGRMLELNRRAIAARTPAEKARIAREIEAGDRRIDQLVYELYGLTEDEIRIVEEATAIASPES